MENQKLKLATVCAVLLAMGGGMVKVGQWMGADALWKQGIEYEMKEINASMERNMGDRWRRSEMRHWVREARKRNPELDFLDVDEVPSYPLGH